MDLGISGCISLQLAKVCQTFSAVSSFSQLQTGRLIIDLLCISVFQCLQPLNLLMRVLINLVVLFSPLCFRGRTHGHPCKTHHQADGMGHYGCSYEERVALFVALSHNIASCVSFVYVSFDHLE